MVKTTYPTQIKYMNKFSLLLWVLFCFTPFNASLYNSVFSWKRGKLPRMTHNDDGYTKYAHNGRGYRFKYLLNPALHAYPGEMATQQKRALKTFFKKHSE